MVRRSAGAVLWAFLLCAELSAQAPARVDFGRDVQPILKQYCVECHGPAQQMRGLRLDRRRDAMPNKVGANGARIVPGSSSTSRLYQRLIGNQSGPQMPPEAPLRQEHIDIIKSWIDQGAEWPDAAAGDTVTTQPDPAVAQIEGAFRSGNRHELERALGESPKSINGKGAGGWTPIMLAALYGRAEDISRLLAQGADPNAQNDGGGTALMYAVEDADKTRLLLEAGADVNARSGEGRTPLLIAVGRTGSTAVVKLLLDKGASTSVRLADGRGALQLAVGARDASLLSLLLERDAALAKTPIPLGLALRSGCIPCFDVLLPLAAPGDLNAALTAAVRLGDVRRMTLLLDRGAQPEPNILQTVALSPSAISADAIGTLIAKGAKVDLTPLGGSLVDFARRNGNTTLANALSATGGNFRAADHQAPASRRPASIRAALEKSVPLLQRADAAFLEKAGCVSCHNNSLMAMTASAVRAKGIRVDEGVARTQLQKTARYMEENRERALENAGIPGGIDTVSYILLGMAVEKYPGDSTTDAWARYVKNNQSPDGRWQCQTLRPPLESSDFQTTAASIRSVRAYAPKSQRAEYDRAVSRAIRWLEQARPETTEDHVFKIFGLIWGAGSRTAIEKTARELLALQRSDGGWGQVSSLASDAYATGQALVALRESRLVAADSTAYRRGIEFLLDSQLEDGSWHVRTRALPIQPHFDSDFPHGLDQFISAAATNWAAMALATVVR